MLETNKIWGARLMWWDLPALLVRALGTAWLWPHVGSIALLAPLLVGHFLLFCNIFRVRQNLELLWSALFVANTALWLNMLGLDDDFAWIASTQLLATGAVIGYELRSWRYHGIFADRLNPQLERYIAWVKGRTHGEA